MKTLLRFIGMLILGLIVIFGILTFCDLINKIKKPTKNEKYYTQLFSDYINSDKIEYRLKDNSRVDIITTEYAIEIDFGIKWYESIGQSLYYSLQTGLKPGIVLITNNNKQLNKLLIVAKEYNITVWGIDKNTERIKLWIK